MLDSEIIKKIGDFVYAKPRSIQEVAQHINKNWRTADRYIEYIETNFGTLATRVFREGTRGALKIVYWASVEKASSSVFQEKLEQEIIMARRKDEFSAFDIFQHVSDKNKQARKKIGESEVSLGLEDLGDLLLQAKKQLLIFSGNLSFINFKDKKIDAFKILEQLVKRGVSMKVICRVDLAGKENIEKILSLNFKYGKELVEIHHREQPLRAIIVDNKIFNIKEIKEPTGREYELKKKIYIFYTIKDKDWVDWLSKIFWKMFSESVDVRKRLEEMNKLK
ncbi:MAG: hypothetical protein KKB21_01850 [Nanoarchaeota archaeon]|nr:hypothetical protein [Nanoarchaeota archaeon]